jgi:2-dehydro-3-deoxyphosphogluconate aldolase/(4S)-4-hydroxy-2-oxoglutarate aldolase
VNKEAIRNRIAEFGIVPAIRLASPEDALFAVDAVSASGLPIAEVTMTTPGAIQVISELARNKPNLIIGAGTIVDIEIARQCVDAGAMFLTSPGLDLQVVEFALKRNVVVFPGALTPSEVMAAWKAGSDFVKVFPCSLLGGVSYIRALRAPFPEIQLIASGGVTQTNTGDFILAGAAGVGIGRDLISPEAIHRREVDWIRELTRRFMQIVKDARVQRAA